MSATTDTPDTTAGETPPFRYSAALARDIERRAVASDESAVTQRDHGRGSCEEQGEGAEGGGIFQSHPRSL